MQDSGGRDFARLWFGQSVSEVGSRITRDGLPITAAQLLNAGPLQMGILGASNTAAVLLVGLAAGVIADRFRRRPLMIFADVGRALLLATIPVAAIAGRLSIEHLLIVAALTGILTVLFEVSWQAYLPSLVSGDFLARANRRLAVSAAGAEVAGPLLTGVLIQSMTTPLAILLDAMSFIVSAGSLHMIRTEEVRVEPAVKGLPTRDEFIDGWRAIVAHPVLRALLLRSGTGWLFSGMIMALYTLLAIRIVQLSVIQYGAVIAVGGTGALIGAGLTRRFESQLSGRSGIGSLFFGSSLALGLATAGIPLAVRYPQHGFALLCASQLVGDCALSFYTVAETTFRQRTVDSSLLGRTGAVMQLASHGMLPIASLAGGVVADDGGWLRHCGSRLPGSRQLRFGCCP